MKRLIGILIAGSFLGIMVGLWLYLMIGPAMNSAPVKPAPVKPAPIEAQVIGPTEVKLSQPAVFTLRGIPREHLSSFDWMIFRKPDDAMVLKLAEWGTGDPVLVFWTDTPDYYALIADVNIPGGYQLIIHEFRVGKGEPDPDPQPDPDPDPNPGPAKKLMVLVITELTTWRKGIDRPPVDYFHIMHSLRINQWLEDNGHLIECRDKDTPVEITNVPGGLARWVKEIGNESLPRVFLIDRESGEAVWGDRLSKTEEEFFEVIKEWGEVK